ncbi:hypothetical protein [Kribbella sp. VKM Ac-2569]|uniref:hypothetical protein n=1 Tax=Kribbella sp. VKM Ac-2569 TaxID=2512220 RepID=UPI00102CE028|nr:hypothetical protein [Kribbella sp. VKM Ac-2569]
MTVSSRQDSSRGTTPQLTAGGTADAHGSLYLARAVPQYQRYDAHRHWGRPSLEESSDRSIGVVSDRRAVVVTGDRQW